MSWSRGARVFVALSGLLCACVRVEVPREEYSRTRLMMAKDIKGVQLQWMSEKDRRYALLYRNPEAGDPRWKPMPDYGEIRGTGDMITLRLTQPGARNMEYRLQTLVGVERDQVR